MASIQASLNQLFMTSLGAGYALTQNPMVKSYVEKKEAGKTLEKSLGAIEQLKDKRNTGELTREEYNAAMTQAGQEAAALTKKVSTTPEEYAEGLSLQQRSLREVEPEPVQPTSFSDAAKNIPGLTSAADVLARQQAAQEAKRGVQNAVKQRKSFLEAMKNERVAFGKGAGTKFGELPPELQKQIASQYSKSERKKVMDKYYGKE